MPMHKTKEIMRNELNKILCTYEIPNQWNSGTLKRLYKGKGKKDKCSNERGITLASNTGKLYERIINKRIREHTNITNLQAGGIPGSATVDHLIALKQTVKEIHAEKKQHT